MYVGCFASSPSWRRSVVTAWYTESWVTTTPDHTWSSNSSMPTVSPARFARYTSRRNVRASSRTVSVPRVICPSCGSTRQSPTCSAIEVRRSMWGVDISRHRASFSVNRRFSARFQDYSAARRQRVRRSFHPTPGDIHVPPRVRRFACARHASCVRHHVHARAQLHPGRVALGSSRVLVSGRAVCAGDGHARIRRDGSRQGVDQGDHSHCVPEHRRARSRRAPEVRRLLRSRRNTPPQRS